VFLVIAACGVFLTTEHTGAIADPISIGTMSRGIGVTGTVKLQAHDISFPELGAWQIDVTYSQAIVDAVSCANLAGTASCNKDYAVNKVRLVGSSTNGLTGVTINLATLGFQCLAPGTSSLTLTVDVLADPDGDPVPHSIQNGSVVCSQFVGGIARLPDVSSSPLRETSGTGMSRAPLVLATLAIVGVAFGGSAWLTSRRHRTR
jgi:hypothetical protein